MERWIWDYNRQNYFHEFLIVESIWWFESDMVDPGKKIPNY